MIGFEKFKVCQKAIRKVNWLELVSILSLAFQLESERVKKCLFYALNGCSESGALENDEN